MKQPISRFPEALCSTTIAADDAADHHTLATMATTVAPHPTLTSLSDPLSNGRIQVLLIPVGPVSPAAWDKWAKAIRSFGEIRLSDVPGTSGNAKGGRGQFVEDPAVG
jgi:hypothetical protein